MSNQFKVIAFCASRCGLFSYQCHEYDGYFKVVTVGSTGYQLPEKLRPISFLNRSNAIRYFSSLANSLAGFGIRITTVDCMRLKLRAKYSGETLDVFDMIDDEGVCLLYWKQFDPTPPSVDIF